VLLAVLAAVAAHALALREVQRQVDERLAEGLEEPMSRLQARLREVEQSPEAMRAVVGTIRRDLGTRARILSLEAAQLLGADPVALQAGQIEVVRDEGRRSLVASIGEDRVLVVGPFRDRPGRRLIFVLTWTLVIVLVVGVGLWLTLRPIERRLQSLSELAERFGRGELGVRSGDTTDDGIGRLSTQFDFMADRVEGLLERQRDQLRAVSHELRTPLARIFFLVDEALESQQARDKDAKLRRIERSVHEMNELVEELLLFARLDPDAGELRREEFDLSPMFDEMLEVVHEVSPSLVVQLDLAVGRMWGSPRYVRRALLNLVTNASRYARRQVSISASTVEGFVELTVMDDGDGIRAENREKIFEPFAQLEKPSLESKSGGAGLGLAIVRRILRAHGGEVTVQESELGGASFVMRFPLRPRSASAVERPIS
jgi:signal transduction histidine kinase